MGDEIADQRITIGVCSIEKKATIAIGTEADIRSGPDERLKFEFEIYDLYQTEIDYTEKDAIRIQPDLLKMITAIYQLSAICPIKTGAYLVLEAEPSLEVLQILRGAIELYLGGRKLTYIPLYSKSID
jgi:hypothetical protein